MQATNHVSEGYTPVLKPKTDITRSPKLGDQRPPSPKNIVVLKNFKTKIYAALSEDRFERKAKIVYSTLTNSVL